MIDDRMRFFNEKTRRHDSQYARRSGGETADDADELLRVEGLRKVRLGVAAIRLAARVGDAGEDDQRNAAQRHAELSPAVCRRLARDYGSRAEPLLSGGLGDAVAPGLFEAELHYLHTHEWARTADDVLWRRTKLGLHLSATQRQAVADWCTRHWDQQQQGAGQTAHAPTGPAETTWN